MKTSLRIEIDPAFRDRIRSMNREERRSVGLAIDEAVSAWGDPHLHAGTGLRKLTRTYFECRSGLRIRLVFKVLGPNTLYFMMLGDHDEVRKFLKIRR